MKDIRLGFYLLPSYQLAKELQILRLVLKDQFNLSAALRFMTHMTIKGFFKPAEDKSRKELFAAIGRVAGKTPAFDMKQSGFRIDNVGCYLWFNPDDNPVLQNLHEGIIDVLFPFISTDCDFSSTEAVKSSFNPHMTLAMTDIPEKLTTDVIGYLDRIVLDREVYPAGNLRLFEFSSADWKNESGHWIDTLEWEILKSWEL